ncbi:MAG TPA: DUF4259 domain-containing protein [Chthoniobacterales bacterium]|jgi:hypothetical protein
MGAWDFGPFDNDDAADWLYELESTSDTSAIVAALAVVTEAGDDYLEAPDCSNALAAVEIVAALRGSPLAKLPDNAKAWVAAHRALDTTSLVPIAQTVVQRIRTNSELKELWDESEEAAMWYATLDDVSSRLNRQ